ncbi:hypothetical protein ASC64_06750 [Nocardioides sp. Root122]|uniref:hypothetical protein n=1 Tax=Nocardioides TaxID=1839 RepID=UPI000703B34F|nr:MULTISPECIES: hypothetical protein [Nocardioides]KQV69540.1 hypothetical protein ASC64_06750 [Nocardioides sp. Root122]MCK9825824.1 hypothetical protein [Nocardioides cavernae]
MTSQPVHHLAIDEAERRARSSARWETAPETTFAMTDEDHDRWLASYHPPTAEELSYAPVPGPPAGVDSWFHWASERGRRCRGWTCPKAFKTSDVSVGAKRILHCIERHD